MSEQSVITISKIKITNCFVYKGIHEIEFSTDPKKNINVIRAISGTGKSKLFELVYWGIYGKHYVQNNDTEEGIINSDLLSELKINEDLESSVEIIILDNNKEKYKITRKLIAKKIDEDSSLRYNEENNSNVKDGIRITYSSSLIHTSSSGRVPITNEIHIQNEIGTILPLELNQFILFNGEKLDLIQKKRETVEFIKDGIEKISGLPILDILRQNTKIISQHMIDDTKINDRQFNTAKNRYSEQNEKLNNLKRDLEKYQNDLETKTKELETTEISIESLEDKIKHQEEIKNNQANLKPFLDEMKKLDQRKKELFYDSLPKLWTNDLFINCAKNFQILRDRQEFPTAFSKEAINSILNKNPLECICGRPFNEGSDEEKCLKEMLDSSKDIRDSTILAAGANIIESSINKEELYKKIEDISGKYLENKKKAVDINNIIEGLEKEHGKVPVSADKETLHKKNIEKKGSLKIEIDNLKQKISDKREEVTVQEFAVDKVKADFEKEGKKFHAFNVVKGRRKILESVEKYLKKKRDELAFDYRQTVTQKTESYFKKFGPQSGDYSGVAIDENYDIKVKKDKIGTGGLSQGQAHSLVISYISGCRSIYPQNLFLMMDSPFHNISEDERKGAMDMVHGALSGIQVILFMTDSEYTSASPGKNSIQKYLLNSKNLGKEYEIKRTCLDCQGKILESIKSNPDSEYDDFKCMNCDRVYIKNEKMGPRIIVGGDI